MSRMNRIKRATLALAAVTMLVGCGPKGGDEMAAAKEHLEKGEVPAAIVRLKSVLSHEPSKPEARFLLGQALMRSGDFTSAILELKKAAELGVPADTVVPEVARAMLEQGAFQAVVAEYSATQLKAAKAQADLKASLATAYANVGEGDKVESIVREAYATAPELPTVVLAYAKLLAGKGQVDEALKLTDRLSSDSQHKANAQFLRGEILMRAGRGIDEALAAFKLAAAEKPKMVNAHVAIIGIEVSRGRLNDAQQQLQAFRQALPQHPQVLYTAAQLAYIAADYPKARDALTQLLKGYPDVAALRTFAGVTQFKLGQVLQAESNLAKAVQLEPKLALAREYLARVYLRMGQPDRALVVLAPLIGPGRSSPEALAVAGQAHLLSGQFARAEAMFAEALKIKPDDSAVQTSAALALLAKGRSEEGLRSLQAVSEKDAGVVADQAIVSARMHRGEHVQALEAIDRIDRKLPNDPLASELRGRVLRVKGDLAGARAAFEGALKIQPAYFAATRQLVAMALSAKDPELARRYLDAAVLANPANADARLALIDVRSRNGEKREEIGALVKAAVDANPTHVPTRLRQIGHFATLRDSKQRLAAAQDAVAAVPDDVDLLGALGDAQLASDQAQQALRTYQRIVTLDQKSELGYVRLADVSAVIGDAAGAVAVLRRGLEAVPGSKLLRQRLVMQSRKVNSDGQALAIARDVQRKWPDEAGGFMAEGDIHAAKKSWALAAAAYRQATVKKVPDPLAAPKAHGALVAAGDKAGAQEFAANWQRAHPKDAAFLAHLGNRAILADGADNLALAERHLSEAVRLQPGNVKALNNLAWVMAERGSKGAVVHARRAVSLAPGDPLMLDTLAKAEAVEGALDDAIATQKSAVQLAPKFLELQLNLAKLYVKAGKKPEALEVLSPIIKAPKFSGLAEAQALHRSISSDSSR